MRILIVAHDPEAGRAHATDLRRAGFEVGGQARPPEATSALRRLRAGAAVLLDDGPVPLEAGTIRTLVGRLRGVAESVLPVALLLGDDSVWLRARLAADLAPITALPLDASARSVGEALERLDRAAGPFESVHGVAPRLDIVRRQVFGPQGAVALTPSEVTIAWELATADGAVVTYDALSRALWGVEADGAARAALRTHLHSVRLKLRRVAPDLEVHNRPGVGYYVSIPLTVREPRG